MADILVGQAGSIALASNAATSTQSILLQGFPKGRIVDFLLVHLAATITRGVGAAAHELMEAIQLMTAIQYVWEKHSIKADAWDLMMDWRAREGQDFPNKHLSAAALAVDMYLPIPLSPLATQEKNFRAWSDELEGSTLNITLGPTNVFAANDVDTMSAGTLKVYAACEIPPAGFKKVQGGVYLEKVSSFAEDFVQTKAGKEISLVLFYARAFASAMNLRSAAGSHYSLATSDLLDLKGAKHVQHRGPTDITTTVIGDRMLQAIPHFASGVSASIDVTRGFDVRNHKDALGQLYFDLTAPSSRPTYLVEGWQT